MKRNIDNVTYNDLIILNRYSVYTEKRREKEWRASIRFSLSYSDPLKK